MDGAVQRLLAALPIPAADDAADTPLERIARFVDAGDLWGDADRVAETWRRIPKRCLAHMLKTRPGDATNQAALDMKGVAVDMIWKFLAEMGSQDAATARLCGPLLDALPFVEAEWQGTILYILDQMANIPTGAQLIMESGTLPVLMRLFLLDYDHDYEPVKSMWQLIQTIRRELDGNEPLVAQWNAMIAENFDVYNPLPIELTRSLAETVEATKLEDEDSEWVQQVTRTLQASVLDTWDESVLSAAVLFLGNVARQSRRPRSYRLQGFDFWQMVFSRDWSPGAFSHVFLRHVLDSADAALGVAKDHHPESEVCKQLSNHFEIIAQYYTGHESCVMVQTSEFIRCVRPFKDDLHKSFCRLLLHLQKRWHAAVQESTADDGELFRWKWLDDHLADSGLWAFSRWTIHHHTFGVERAAVQALDMLLGLYELAEDRDDSIEGNPVGGLKRSLTDIFSYLLRVSDLGRAEFVLQDGWRVLASDLQREPLGGLSSETTLALCMMLRWVVRSPRVQHSKVAWMELVSWASRFDASEANRVAVGRYMWDAVVMAYLLAETIYTKATRQMQLLYKADFASIARFIERVRSSAEPTGNGLEVDENGMTGWVRRAVGRFDSRPGRVQI